MSEIRLTEAQLEDERHAHNAEIYVLVDQRDKWIEAFGILADSVFEGVYFNYDVKEDSGGSTFLCTYGCKDGYPHDPNCGAFLVSANQIVNA